MIALPPEFLTLLLNSDAKRYLDGRLSGHDVMANGQRSNPAGITIIGVEPKRKLNLLETGSERLFPLRAPA